MGASWDRAGQAAESAAARVPRGGVRGVAHGVGRSSSENARVRGWETMRTYRAMPPHGRLELQPAKRMKMVARSLHFGAAAEVARRPPWRTAAQPAEGGG